MTDQPIFTVTELNHLVKNLLEEAFTSIWVEGEISNFIAASSGHWYFTLKDANAQIRVAMFKTNQRGLNLSPKNGMHVLVRGRVSLYPNRGDYQLIADSMEDRGIGKLRQAFEALKKKLANEGLFDEAHKKSLPAYPARIGVITSKTGAAIRDILHVLKRRYPIADVVIYPTLVQGAEAADGIVHALQLANKRAECDVLILARGGGSLEDLWSFNEEKVARAIFKSKLPIISGVGHEVDFTIADFVADVRAPTPSAAAEIATPNKKEVLLILSDQQKQLARLLLKQLEKYKERLHWSSKHLLQLHPKRQLREKMQRVDDDEARLLRAIHKKIQYHHTQLATKAATLHALSPLATLQRGYAIVNRNGKTLNSTTNISIGDAINVRVKEGEFECAVTRIF